MIFVLHFICINFSFFSIPFAIKRKASFIFYVLTDLQVTSSFLTNMKSKHCDLNSCWSSSKVPNICYAFRFCTIFGIDRLGYFFSWIQFFAHNRVCYIFVGIHRYNVCIMSSQLKEEKSLLLNVLFLCLIRPFNNWSSITIRMKKHNSF